MKGVILFLGAVVLGIFICKGQVRDCANAKVYDLIFKELNLYERKAVDIKIGYKPTDFIVNSIGEMNIFNTNEMKQFNSTSNDIDYLSCLKFKRQIELILSNDLIKENGSYHIYKFSRIISLSLTKKCVLMYLVAKNIKYEGGKAIGGEMMFVLNNDNGKWSLTDKKLVAMY